VSQDDLSLSLIGLLTKRFKELQAAFQTLSKQPGPAGATGKDGARGKDGSRGIKGADGKKGDRGEKGAPGKDGEQGPAGETGPKPKHEWRGTKLRFEKPDGTWGKLVDLKGEAGKNGIGGGGGGGGSGQPGPPGPAGPPGIQGPAGPPGAGTGSAPFWWIVDDQVVEVPARTQYVIHGEFRNEGEIRVGQNAEIRVLA